MAPDKIIHGRHSVCAQAAYCLTRPVICKVGGFSADFLKGWSHCSVTHSCISSGSFTVTSEGCEVFLACGIRFYFPPEAASDPLRIYFRTLAPDPQWVKLRHHDVLLSKVLELQPHGVKFQQVRADTGCCWIICLCSSSAESFGRVFWDFRASCPPHCYL